MQCKTCPGEKTESDFRRVKRTKQLMGRCKVCLTGDEKTRYGIQKDKVDKIENENNRRLHYLTQPWVNR